MKHAHAHNHPRVWIIGLVVVAALAAASYGVVQVTKESPEPTAKVIDQKAELTKEGAITETKPGAYVDYSDSVIASTRGKKVLFFHAPWCPQCRALDTDIRAGMIPANATIIKTDYDSNQKLRAKYGVTLQTTFVLVDDQGNLVKKYVAYETPNLDAVVKNVLN